MEAFAAVVRLRPFQECGGRLHDPIIRPGVNSRQIAAAGEGAGEDLPAAGRLRGTDPNFDGTALLSSKWPGEKLIIAQINDRGIVTSVQRVRASTVFLHLAESPQIAVPAER